MEAKDTIIYLGKTSNKSLRIIMEKILLEQAEISFEAGKQAGRREVIGAINLELVESDSRNMFYLNKRFWQVLKGGEQ